ncbi:hypothetical protein DAPPUDRAFT_305111 [Daphnia pulex]|uniref:Uncharacterized protein n=1 Tax=Daphnia pulex TaxID=6669 RepID=E9GNZ7_DAPPU|nr:hypothetical protein DAPPUDRAFT_305111 [Daphnia pulex]|eukprot:EFX78859.1 hypothetical protein DAPPUDRAFT_305111 [Daphnia pulex]
MQVARAIVFDMRNAEANNPNFIFSAEALHEVSLLAHAGTCSNFAFISLVLVGVKGFEILLDTHPLVELDSSLKRAFGKLKQLLKISNEEYCIASTQLEIVVVTATDGEKILKELDSFLFNTKCPEFKQVVVLHVAPSELLMQNQMEQVSRSKIVWRMSEEERDAEIFFKSWLSRKRKNWNLEMRSDGQCEWTSRIDIEDLMFDVKGWPYRISANFNETNGIGIFDDGNMKTLEIIKWVRGDGVPAWLIHGMPRRLLPASDLSHDDIVFKINNEQFFSLSRWLAREALVAIVKLESCQQAIDYFILTPGSDGSLLMRSIAPREVILPPSTCLPVTDDQDDDAELFTEKEICFEEIQSAFLQLPAHTFSRSEKSSVMEAVEFHTVTDIQYTGTKSKPTLNRPRKARR